MYEITVRITDQTRQRLAALAIPARVPIELIIGNAIQAYLSKTYTYAKYLERESRTDPAAANDNAETGLSYNGRKCLRMIREADNAKLDLIE